MLLPRTHYSTKRKQTVNLKKYYKTIRVLCTEHALLAQSVEHQNLGQRVVGSHPITATVFISCFMSASLTNKILKIRQRIEKTAILECHPNHLFFSNKCHYSITNTFANKTDTRRTQSRVASTRKVEGPGRFNSLCVFFVTFSHFHWLNILGSFESENTVCLSVCLSVRSCQNAETAKPISMKLSTNGHPNVFLCLFEFQLIDIIDVVTTAFISKKPPLALSWPQF